MKRILFLSLLFVFGINLSLSAQKIDGEFTDIKEYTVIAIDQKGNVVYEGGMLTPKINYTFVVYKVDIATMTFTRVTDIIFGWEFWQGTWGGLVTYGNTANYEANYAVEGPIMRSLTLLLTKSGSIVRTVSWLTPYVQADNPNKLGAAK